MFPLWLNSIKYRASALPTSVSKMFELTSQKRMSPNMNISDAQFGFNASHGTDMAIFCFKESDKKFLNCGSPAFICFLDATKAFDRENHTKLFNIWKTRKISEYWIGILFYWRSNWKYAVRWGNAISSHFEISNGIRQGAILSPILYNLYTDSLSTHILSSRIGCHTAGDSVNHIAYADDSFTGTFDKGSSNRVWLVF